MRASSAVLVVVVLVGLVAIIVVVRRPAGDHDAQPGNTTIQSFNKAKRALGQVYEGHRETLYCGCRYGADRKVDLTGCGYAPKRDNKRAHRVEWEHVVPAAAFGRSLAVWRDGHPDCVDSRGRSFRGRQCARKVSAEFRYMEADLYNLHPAIGEVNALRSDRGIGEIPGEARELGRCDFESSGRQVEPRTAVRGDIARTYLYMDLAYPGRGLVSRANRQLLERWGAEDPVDEWECARARRVEALQRNTNRVVAAACADRDL
jgi:deoxyribonuclease-1